MKLAVLPVGYKDGYGRHLSNKGEVLVGGDPTSPRRAGLRGARRCKVVGRICMRMTIVDVSEVKDVKLGDTVVLIGRQKDDKIEASELAEKIGTIPYEVLTRIAESVPRIYRN